MSDRQLALRLDPTDGVQAGVPCAARIYDWLLGGKDNFEADRTAGEKLLKVVPSARQAAQANRWFLIRAITYAARMGHTQYLEIGSGLPTKPSVHQAATALQPGARVVYADHDEVVLTHGRCHLENEHAEMIRADLTDPDDLLEKVGHTLDLQQRVVVSLVGVLHFVSDESRPAQLLEKLRNGLAPGSLFILSHGCLANTPQLIVDGVTNVSAGWRHPVFARSEEAILAMLQGTLHEPGLVPVWQWDPDGIAEPHEKEPIHDIDLRAAVVDWSPGPVAASMHHVAR